VRPLVRPANPPKPPPPPVPDPPGGTGYPIVRLDTLTNLRNDLALITLARPSQTVRDGLNIPNGPVTMLNVVEGLLTLAQLPRPKKRKKNDPPPPKPTPLQSAKSNLESQVELYRDANPYLKTGLGLYCDYCEQVLSEMIAVEHVVPKAPFPLTSLCWQNFLLCCRACNSKKGDTPAREELVLWNLNPAPANELERYAAVRAHYLWPDNGHHTVNYPKAYKDLVPAFFYYEGNAWQRLKTKFAVADGLVVKSRGTALNKKVVAIIPDLKGGTWELPVQVQLLPRGSRSAQAQATLDMMDMNLDGAGKNDDNRTWDRTLRWLDAVEAFTDLKNGWSSALFKSVCKNAKTGFLSTWVRVLELRGGGAVPYPDDTSKTLLEAFIEAMTQQTTEPYGPYPNTNTTYLP
jgi:5-methylcytosine-specific restriction endonuclease McrA